MKTNSKIAIKTCQEARIHVVFDVFEDADYKVYKELVGI